MDTFIRFLYEFMSVFFKGLGMMVTGFFKGIIQMFKIPEYLYIIEFYRKDLKVGEWVLVIIAIIAMIILLGLIVLLFVFLIKKVFKFRKTLVEQESMLQEIGELNKEVATLVEEKEKILAMKVLLRLRLAAVLCFIRFSKIKISKSAHFAPKISSMASFLIR